MTGASRGVGKGVALGLAQPGRTVIITGRSLDDPSAPRLPGTLRDTADAIEARGATCVPIRCDHGDGYIVKRVVERTPGHALALEVLEQRVELERDVGLEGVRFALTPTADGRTEVSITARYRRVLFPQWLWRPVEERVIHALHRHALDGMREHAEGRSARAARRVPESRP